MIPIYDIEDFSPCYTKERHFLIAPFEQLNRPPVFIWPHKHSFYEILWIRNGKSKHFIDHHELNLSTDSIYFMAPGQMHRFEKYEDVKGDIIMFTEEFFILNFTNMEAQQKLSFLDSSYTKPNLKLDEQTKKSLEPILQLLYDEFSRDDHSNLSLSSLLYVFLNNIQRVYFTQNTNECLSKHIVLYNKFKKLVEANYKKQESLAFYAEQLYITSHHLNEIVKKVSGKTAGELIRSRILLEAKRLLVHSHMPIGQIADELGFKDFSYFSRQFKKHNKISPDQYRNQILRIAAQF
ncbi:helix-turn-helix transcriptional regulator [Pedobacter antarcticus]|uniref:helix-turn-helix transcriptional regulator n=1 Tax=Pedobacter antarcticus TaxID=34086 RepID=UPI00292CA800|nr:helix-turn-helix transcriptional regulator [Pedobacter antarcticus]